MAGWSRGLTLWRVRLPKGSRIFDALGPVRNRASIAHPNIELLAEPEAMLVINVGRTLLNYLDAKRANEILKAGSGLEAQAEVAVAPGSPPFGWRDAMSGLRLGRGLLNVAPL